MPSPRTHSLARRLVHLAAAGFGVGRAPVAPGTFGTLVAVPIYLLLRETGTIAYVVVVIALFALGVWLCSVTEQDLGTQDAPSIVWDEIVGYLVTMIAAPRGGEWVVAGFLLFRLFDIAKPFPIYLLERRIGGGLGIMLDDALAGIYALLVLQVAAFTVALTR